MIQDLAAKLSTAKRSRITQTEMTAGWGGIDAIMPLPTPWEAHVNGVPVTVLLVANQQGSSPVELCVETTGEQAFLPLSEVRLTDPRLLPRATASHATTTGTPTTTRRRGRKRTSETATT